MNFKNNFKVAILTLIFAMPFAANAKDANPEDVKSIDAIIAALYDVVSGSKEERRDWERMSSLFVENGLLIPSGANGFNMMTVEDYSVMGDKTFSQIDFFEVENSKVVERFGHIAHVFSTYESRYDPSDEVPFQRGINSIQLRYDGERWWIMTVFWLAETDDLPIPEKYIK